MPIASASSAAAVADGARPITDPLPCVAVQAWARANRVVVLPVPAGPTRTSTRLPDVAIVRTAPTWSAARRRLARRRGLCRGLSTIEVTADGRAVGAST